MYRPHSTHTHLVQRLVEAHDEDARAEEQERVRQVHVGAEAARLKQEYLRGGEVGDPPARTDRASGAAGPS